MSMEAYQISEHCANPIELCLRGRDRALLMLRAGRTESALHLLQPTQIVDTPFSRADIALLRTECLLALGERAEAQDWLQHAWENILAHGLPLLRLRAEALAQRF